MDHKRLRKLLGNKEGIHLEYKTASTDQLPKSLFESICAMLNREGGDIFLGVLDNGTVVGLNKEHIDQLTKDLVSLSNNPSKLDPPFILHPQTLDIDGEIILHITVPVSSEVHKSVNVVYDRSHDGDFKVTQLSKIAALYNSKRNYYSESMVYPGITMADFKPELFEIARNLIKTNNANHPWINLDNEQLMKIAGLYGKDNTSNQEGYNLAAVLLFGTDQTILNTVSYYKIDALVRREDVYRYDDRLYIQTNLIEAYDQLSAFAEKHLPDKFFLRGDQRISLRSHIFREVIANLIIHREYLDASPSTFVIYNDRVEVTNANNPHGNGLLLPDSFSPFPKNPLIAKFFIQLGRVDELGSGVINVYRYLKDYSPGREPQFIEDKLFKTVIPIGGITTINTEGKTRTNDEAINEAINEAVNEAINTQVKDRLIGEVEYIHQQGGVTTKALISKFQLTRITVQRDIRILKKADLITFQGSNKNGKYILTDKGTELFHKFNSN